MDSEACNKANRDRTQSANGTSRLHLLLKAAFYGTLLITASCAAYRAPQPRSDYSRLVELIKLEDREEPLYAFNDFAEGFDEDSHRANLEYLEDHPGLIILNPERAVKCHPVAGRMRAVFERFKGTLRRIRNKDLRTSSPL